MASGRSSAQLPAPPERKAAVFTGAIGLATIVCGLVPLVAAGSAHPGVLLVLSGAINLYVSYRGARDGAALQRLRVAADRHASGSVEDAYALLDEAARRSDARLIVRYGRLARAAFALRERDHARAAEEATAALERTPRPRFSALNRGSRAATWTVDASLLGVRALARALLGDADGARADASALDVHLEKDRPREVALQVPPVGGVRALEEALARARLAEAIVLARAADRDALGAHLAKHRSVILHELGPEERALVRGFDRMLAIPGASPYRATGGAAHGGEGLSELLGRLTPGDGKEPVKTDAVADADGMGKATRRDWASTKRVALGIGFGVFMAAFIGLMTAYQSGSRFFSTPMFVALLLAPTVAFVTYVLMTVRKQASQRGELVDVRLRVAADPTIDVTELVAEQARSSEPLARSQSNLMLARQANASGAFAAALERADSGLVPLQGGMLKAVTGATLVPALVTERALAKAGLGRAEDAIKDVESIPVGVAFRSRSIESVRLVAAAARDDREAATRLAYALSNAAIALDLRVEMLVHVLRAVATGGSIGQDDMHHLEHELAAGSEGRRWLDAVAPLLLRDFDALAADDDERERRGDADASENEAAEKEMLADAEAEAADERSARRVGGP